MQEDKYYTPDIEDIRVGYEGEINWSRGYSETFVPFKITVQNEDFAYTGLLSEIVDAMDDGYAEVKTPYLTKEQIEGEQWKGWTGVASYEKTAPHLYVSKRQGKDYTDLINVIYNIDTHELVVYKKGEVIFNGLCLSINEFRIITNKLLQIK